MIRGIIKKTFKHSFVVLFYAICALIILGGVFLFLTLDRVKAVGNTYTVCDLGCDYTTLTDASIAPGLSEDTIKISTGYTFSDVLESATISLPNDITLTCDPGVTFGDAAQSSVQIFPGDTNVIDSCTFENINFDTTGKTDVTFSNNTFSDAASSELVFTLADDFEISNNTAIQKVQLQNADNGVITGNTFECRFTNNCLNFVTAGGGPFDYSNPADVSNDVAVSDNTFSNYNVATGGDWVYVGAGLNIDFIGNTFQSGVTTNDSYITMVSIQNSETYFSENLFLFPSKSGSPTNGTWGLNLRVDEEDITTVVEHNTFVMVGPTAMLNASSCIGLFDNGNVGTPDVSLTAEYNLCENGTGTSGGVGVNFSYVPATINITFSDQYNGFHDIDTLVSDNNSLITSLDATTVEGNPLFRTENVSNTDDYELAPMSRFLDVNGVQDIGAFPGVRDASYTIDDDCTVDYVSCVSHFSTILEDSLKDDDEVTIEEGNYDPITIQGPLDNITIQGAGSTTVFDGGGTVSPIRLVDVTNADISDLQVQDSDFATTTTYEISHSQFTDGVTTYDQGVMLGAPDAVILIAGVPVANTCSSVTYDTDDFDITSVVGAATDNWNLWTVDYVGIKLTVVAPDTYLPNESDLEDCANPGDITIEHFVNDVFTVSGGVFTYNASAVSAEGLSVKTGDTDPPYLNRIVTGVEQGGIYLDNSDNNTFTGITSTDNKYAIVFTGTSQDNIIDSSTLENSDTADVFSDASTDNILRDTDFDRASSVITGTGDVEVQYSIRAYVDNTQSLPLNNVDVTFTSNNGLPTQTVTTDFTGYTPYTAALTAYIMTDTNITETSGGYNPYTIHSDAIGTYGATNTSHTLNTPIETFNITLTAGSSGSSNSHGDGGTAPSVFGPNYAKDSQERVKRLDRVSELPVPVHALIKKEDEATVYYVGADGYRHAFPTSSTYESWYCDTQDIRTVSVDVLSAIPLGKSVTYRPGYRLLQFDDRSELFAVGKQGAIYEITPEQANLWYGPTWKNRIDIVSDTLYADYHVETLPESYDPIKESRIGLISDMYTIAGYVPSAPTPFFCVTLVQPEKKVWPFTFKKEFRFDTTVYPDTKDVVMVRYIQEFLKFMGTSVYTGEVTGNYGVKTIEGIRNLQIRYAITPTGILGPLIRGVINGILEGYK